MKKFAGVWLDHSEAYIVTLSGDEYNVEHLKKEIAGQHRSTGGKRPGLSYGPQDKVNEHRFDEKRKHQIREFHQKILERLRDTDHFYLFGPAEAKKELKTLAESQSAFNEKLIGVENADKMTPNQIVAAVREYHNKMVPFM